MSNYQLLLLLLVLTVLAVVQNGLFTEGGKRRVHIPDELDDVVDDEEDDAWKEWGTKKKGKDEFDPPPDFSTMETADIQAEMMKRQTGPAFGFVKLRLGTRRTPDMVSDIAMKWSKVARTGSVEVKFMGVDVSTVMFTLENGQDTSELKEFMLEQPEAYEVKLGEQLFRRPGDPPFDEVFAKLREEEEEEEGDSSLEDDDQEKDEL